MGNLGTNFTDSEGNLVYALCSTNRYDMDYKNTDCTFSQTLLLRIYTKRLAPPTGAPSSKRLQPLI